MHHRSTWEEMSADTQAVWNVWLNATICWFCPHFGPYELAQQTP